MTSTTKSSDAMKLRVTGMTCTGCAGSIQRALEARDDVTSAAVSFVAGTAEIHGNDLQLESLIRSIREHGYDAEAIEESALVDESSEIERQQAANERTWRYR